MATSDLETARATISTLQASAEAAEVDARLAALHGPLAFLGAYAESALFCLMPCVHSKRQPGALQQQSLERELETDVTP